MPTRNTRTFISSGTEIDGSGGRLTGQSWFRAQPKWLSFVTSFASAASMRKPRSLTQLLLGPRRRTPLTMDLSGRYLLLLYRPLLRRLGLEGQTVPWPARSLLPCWNWSQTWRHVAHLNSHFPMAMLTPLRLNMKTSFGISPIVAIFAVGTCSISERTVTTSPLLAFG